MNDPVQEPFQYPVAKARTTRLEHAEIRAERAKARTEQAKTRIEAAETRTEQAEARIESAKTRTEHAETRTEQAETRTEQAETRAEHAETRAEHAEKCVEQTESLVETLTETLTGGGVTVPPATSPADEAELRALQRLTGRQREVLELTAMGENAKQIGGTLKISPKTVEYHRKKLMDGLDIHDLPGLVRFALRVGLIPATG